VLDCLADDEEAMDHGVIGFVIGEKGIAVHSLGKR
jgi:hypothetical protein